MQDYTGEGVQKKQKNVMDYLNGLLQRLLQSLVFDLYAINENEDKLKYINL